MDAKSKKHFPINNIITPFIAIITGIILSLLISLMSEGFIWNFIKIALFNSTFLGLSMLVCLYFADYYLFRINNSTILILSSLIIMGAGVISLVIIMGFEPTIFFYFSNGMISYLIIFLLFIFSLNLITIGFSIYPKTVQEKENALNEEKLLKKEIELKLLTSKLNPHFLFNSLNLIISLLKNPPKAEKALLYLSELLRYNLDLTNKDMVSMDLEIGGVTKYLELQEMRFEERLEYQIENKAGGAMIQPFIIQPLIENSINHNINDIDVLKIYIRVDQTDDRLEISIIDSCKKVSTEMLGKGTGLTTTKKRVENAGGEFIIKDGGIKISFDHDKNNNSR